MHKATIADVARHAAVSPTTATRVIHNRGYVSEANRVRVLQAVEAVGYRPNIQARSLRQQRSYILGLVLSMARENPFFAHIAHAVRVAAAASGYSVLTINHGYSDIEEVAGVKQFLDFGAAAIILCHAFNEENYQPILRAGLPIVQIERRTIEAASFVGLDPEPGLREAIDHLVSLGHKRIAFIGGGLERDEIALETFNAPDMERRGSFLQGVQRAGLDPAACPVLLGSYVSDEREGRPTGYRMTMDLISGAGVLPVTAIITGSDVLAAGVLQALYEYRLRVPEDVSVIGYDDSFAMLLTPALSSIAQPYREVGAAAMDLIDGAYQYGSESFGKAEVKLPNRLKMRHSTAAAR